MPSDRSDRTAAARPTRTNADSQPRVRTSPSKRARRPLLEPTDGPRGTDATAYSADDATSRDHHQEPEQDPEQLPELLAAFARTQSRTPEDEEALYDEKVWALRLRGLSYREIVRDFETRGQHTDKNRVMRAVQRLLRESAPKRKEARERWLGQAIARLEHVQAAAWTRFDTSADPAYLNTIRAAERDIAQLRGLHAPEADDGREGGITIRISRRGEVAIAADTRSTERTTVEQEEHDGD